MSRFIDKLHQISRAEPQPIGFRAKHPASPKPRLQLVASLAQAGAEDLADRVAGVDAGLLRITKPSSGVKALQNIARTVPDIPWGGWLPAGGQERVKQLMKAGNDFVVFPASSPLATLENSELGRILEVETSLNEGLLRAVNELPVDAVLVTQEEKEDYFLSWQHLMLLQRFADLLTKPLLALIPDKVTADELQALWEAGVDGIVTEVTAEQPLNQLKELRQVMDKLAFTPTRRREKMEPLIPGITQEPEILTAEEEEEE